MRIGAGLEINDLYPRCILKDNIVIAKLSTNKSTIKFWSKRNFLLEELFAIARHMKKMQVKP
jgi:hypothetical protein